MNTRFNIAAGHPTNRRGITLLEVLIAIGILAIGLTSVVALVPAGKSQAARAIVLDRASVLAANALADAATFGLLRGDVLTTISTGTTLSLVDPSFSPGPIPTNWVGGTIGTNAKLRSTGVFASSSDGFPTDSAAGPALRLFTQSRDDVLVTPGATEDDLPSNTFVDGARAFTGRMSCFYWINENLSTLSVVVFHNRDPGLLQVSGTILNGSTLVIAPGDLGDRKPRDVVKPGVVLYTNGKKDVNGQYPDAQFHQALSATFDPTDSYAYVTLSTGTAVISFPAVCPVVIYPDSVGMAKKTFTPESPGPYTQ